MSDTLSSGGSRTYTDIKAHTQPPKSIADENGIASIAMHNRQGEIFTFIDASFYKLKVINMLPVDITIKSDNHIENSAGSMELFIGKDEEATAIIYTKSPVFTTTTTTLNYNVVFDWVFDNDEISVIIR
jgi:hypothetical protein